MSGQFPRRKLLQGIGVVATTGVLAGCSSDSGGGDGGDGGSDGGDDGSSSDGGSGDGGSTESFDGWMDGVGNYDSVVDETGSSEVTVTVGVEGNNGNNGFDPAAVEVSSGTTIVWEWTGEGSHNVVHDDGDFESELTQEEGFTFEQTFDSSGTYKYFCRPHQTFGMKGVVVVE